MILHDRAITGKIKYGTPHIIRRAKYVEPPPRPMLEYKIATMKNNTANSVIKFTL